MALVGDDVYRHGVDIKVRYLLAPFEDVDVDAVSSNISAETPSQRQTANVITAWEATAAFDLCRWRVSREVHFAANGACWVLSGGSLSVRCWDCQR